MDLEQVVMNVDDTETGYFSILHTHTHTLLARLRPVLSHFSQYSETKSLNCSNFKA